MDEMDAELEEEGELPEGTVITSTGVSWNTLEPPHWASRVKKAVQEFPGASDLLSIADVEAEAVANRLRKHVAKIKSLE